MPRDQPAIHVYGTDHSPWVQAVMLTLELKQLEYSMTSSPGPRTMAAGAESKATGRSSPFTMPALWHGDDLVLYESLPIIKFLDREYPDPPLFEGFDEQQVQEHWQQFNAREYSNGLSPGCRLTQTVAAKCSTTRSCARPAGGTFASGTSGASWSTRTPPSWRGSAPRSAGLSSRSGCTVSSPWRGRRSQMRPAPTPLSR